MVSKYSGNVFLVRFDEITHPLSSKSTALKAKLFFSVLRQRNFVPKLQGKRTDGPGWLQTILSTNSQNLIDDNMLLGRSEELA